MLSAESPSIITADIAKEEQVALANLRMFTAGPGTYYTPKEVPSGWNSRRERIVKLDWNMELSPEVTFKESKRTTLFGQYSDIKPEPTCTKQRPTSGKNSNRPVTKLPIPTGITKSRQRFVSWHKRKPKLDSRAWITREFPADRSLFAYFEGDAAELAEISYDDIQFSALMVDEGLHKNMSGMKFLTDNGPGLLAIRFPTEEAAKRYCYHGSAVGACTWRTVPMITHKIRLFGLQTEYEFDDASWIDAIECAFGSGRKYMVFRNKSQRASAMTYYIRFSEVPWLVNHILDFNYGDTTVTTRLFSIPESRKCSACGSPGHGVVHCQCVNVRLRNEA